MRFAVTPSNQRGISWFLRHEPQSEVYGRYCIYIEEDVAIGMTELGVKLPGLAGDEVSWRMEHGRRDPGNPNLYSIVDYRYAADSGPGFGEITGFNRMFRAGRWYVVEQYAKKNTFSGSTANADGVGKVWINGNLVWSKSTVRWQSKAASMFDHMHVNVYHGGMGFPKQNIHYRIAGIAVSTKYIGPPPELANYDSTLPPENSATPTPTPTPTPPPAPTPAPPNPTPVPGPTPQPPPATAVSPAWRQSMAVGVFAPIPNTANMNNVTQLGNGTTMGSNTINAWNGLAAGPTSWWAAANGGHDQGNGNGWENKVYKIDLASNTPKWSLVHPGSPNSAVTVNAHYADGLPTSRHTYYSAQYVASRNRVMLFGALAPYAIGFSTPGAFQGGPPVDGFDVTANRWDAPDTWLPITPTKAAWTAVAVTKHPVTEDVYVSAREVFTKWSAATGQWTTVSPKGGNPGSWEFHPSLIDPLRNRWINFDGAGLMRMLDLSTYAYTKMTATGPLPSIQDYSAFVHDLDNDRYVTVQGTGVYAVNPSTGESVLIATVPASKNGTHNRLAYFRDLGGIAYLPSYESNVLFMRTR
jgi:hypothetical protein